MRRVAFFRKEPFRLKTVLPFVRNALVPLSSGDNKATCNDTWEYQRLFALSVMTLAPGTVWWSVVRTCVRFRSISLASPLSSLQNPAHSLRLSIALLEVVRKRF
jgi:hypothetical protein